MSAPARSRRPPRASGIAYRRRLVRARRDPLDFLLWLARRYGDAVRFRAGPIDAILLNHPEHAREVLVTGHRAFMKGQGLQEAKRVLGEGLLTSESDVHRRQRRLIQPVFHHARIAGYGAVMAEEADRLTERWRDGDVLDVHEEMTRLTLAIVGKTLFDTDVEEREAERVGTSLTLALEMFERTTLPFHGLIERVPLPSNRRFERAREDLDAVVYGLIREHRARGDRGDLLSLLLSARNEAGGGGMSDEQVRDEAMTIFLAGHETTANALTWTWYLLSRHPEEERRLHQEVDAGLDGGLPGLPDLERLPLTERILAEALRLYPPAWILGRRALEDHDVGGITIPGGTLALVAPYLLHHDPRWFPDPTRFDPDRWHEGDRPDRPRLAYLPFGAGPRVCIGESFAWMEGRLVLAAVARRWRLELVPGHAVELLPRVTLRPRHGMRMRVHRR